MEELDRVFGGEEAGPVYARYGNPTNDALETAVAALEGAEAALSFASGMAAIHATLLAAGARAGAAIVAAQDVYGATYALLERVITAQGVQVRFVDATNAENVAEAVEELRPAVVLVETVSNPLLRIADIPRLAGITRAAGAALIVDNTFATPYLCRPLDLGADYVLHSATKYLGGHGDVLGGVVACNAARRRELYELHKLTGANLGPQEAWLVMRGLKTLPLRMERQCSNAAQVARWLESRPQVACVNYPGLPSHPQHEVAQRLLSGTGGAMISFELAIGSQKAVFGFMEALRMVVPATTLGDVYSLVLYPTRSSHRALSAGDRERIGIREGLVRLSVGIEDVDDIIGDLEQALATVGG